MYEYSYDVSLLNVQLFTRVFERIKIRAYYSKKKSVEILVPALCANGFCIVPLNTNIIIVQHATFVQFIENYIVVYSEIEQMTRKNYLCSRFTPVFA